MSFWDDLTGKTAADAAQKAAADTYQKQQVASAGTRAAGDDYLTNLLGLSKGYAPWQQTGQEANNAVLQLLRDPSSVRSLPAYQFLQNEGTKAIDRSAVSNGSLFSGRTGKALETYGQNLADKTYGDQLARLLGISQQGLGATGAAIGTAGRGYGGQLGARTSSYNQDFNSSGTIGQGDVAAANARAQGSQNLLNAGTSLLGTGISAAFGMPGASGSIGKLFGSGNTVNPWSASGSYSVPRAGLDF